MRFTLKNLRFLQYIDYQNVRKTEFLGCQSQEKTRPIFYGSTLWISKPGSQKDWTEAV